MRYRLVLIAAFFLSAFGAEANEEYISGRIISGGDKFGIELEMKEGWHTYAKDPGEAGIPTEFDWSGSRDFKLEKVIYPDYEVIDEAGIKVNGYKGRVFFPVDAEIGENAKVRVKVSGAVCSNICIPYSLDLTAEPEPATGEFGVSIMFIALLAGLILNIMPCVLPVLSLKVLSVIKQSGVEKSRAQVSFLATSLGIIFSFIAMAVFTTILRQTGAQLGWGLHFQSPYFVLTLMVITLLFSLSLFGFFHLRPPSWISGSGENSNSLAGNFMAGVLATVLGTACTAPVVVTAVGFALVGNIFEIFAIFIMMGIGMALPFLIFAVFPGLVKFLPKPGKWMVYVKNLMGVLLLLTFLWLGSILYAQTKTEVEIEDEWVNFNEREISRLVEGGQVVFVDITAEWCVNCKANKVAVLDKEDMRRFFTKNDVVLMRGDMTKPSKILLEYIKTFKRYGIPVNVVYGPNASNGILLEPLLTRSAVKGAVKKAAASN